MNNELQTVLADFITSSMQLAADAKEFMVAEIPDVINQILWWHGVEAFILFMIFPLICLFMFVYWMSFQRNYDTRNEGEKGGDMSWDNIVRVLFGAFTSLIGSIVGLTQVNILWLQIIIAPKLYLIEYAANLVKSTT